MMAQRNLILFLLWFLLVSSGCKNDDDSLLINHDVSGQASTSILFIGNSHTNFNGGIDSQLGGFAQSVNLNSTATRAAPNGFTLQDHLNSQGTLNFIDSQSWDYIILQENTFRAAYETEDMLESISQFNKLLESNSAIIFPFKTWAYNVEPEMNDLLDNAYSQASSASGYPAIAIGSYWNTFSNSSDINLYIDDSVHPNEIGTYLSAGLFFKKIFNYSDHQEVPYTSVIDPTTADTIKTFITNQNI